MIGMEDDIKSFAEPETQQCSPIKSCLKKQVKRKNCDNVQESRPKKFRTGELNKGTLNCYSSTIHCEGSKNLTKKTTHYSKLKTNNEIIDPSKLKNDLEGMVDEIDNVLEESAQKNRLTYTNVKNILKHVITNEYVLSMVRNTMKAENSKEDDLEKAVFEPTLTRSKVKELQEKQHILPWLISTPVKQTESETKLLLEEKFSDWSSSDEDYEPNEEECPSDDDDVASSPKSCDLDLSICKHPVSVQKAEDDVDDVDGLVIALPESELDLNSLLVDSEVGKIALRTRSKLPLNDTPLETIEASLSFVAPDFTVDMYDTHCDDKEYQNFIQDISQPLDANAAVGKPDDEVDDEEDPDYNAVEEENLEEDVDNVALRTRSKLPLNDTPLEAIEASFVAPDITVDMYNVDCGDEEWQIFLQEYSQPLDAIAPVKKPDEEVDDAEEDPEYYALEDDDLPDKLEFCHYNISKKELDGLNAEDSEFDLPCNEGDEDERRNEVPARQETKVSEVECERTQWMTQEERMQFEEQMRMYVQILTQTYLLSCGNPLLSFINQSSKLFMNEIKMLSQRYSVNGQSALYAHNLDGALDIINEYENNMPKLNTQHKSHYKVPDVPSEFKKTLLESDVFIYPELLPICGFHKDPTTKEKTSFVPAEDNLIALGLEQFSFSPTPQDYINQFLVPTKTEEQIKRRIKKSKCIGKPENPIKYYFMNKRAPPLQRTIRVFNPNSVKAPKDQPLEILPDWMRETLSPITKLPILRKPRKAAVSVNKVKKLSPKRRFRLILPRIPPLKPILKKCNQKTLLASHGSSTNVKPKTVRFGKKVVRRLRSISPNLARNRETVAVMFKNEHSSTKETKKKRENINPNVVEDDNELLVASQNARSRTYVVIGETSKTPEYAPDLNASECDDPVDLKCTDKGREGNEDIIDDKPKFSVQHDSALRSNVIGNKHSAIKKKNRQQRDSYSSMAILQPNLMENNHKSLQTKKDSIRAPTHSQLPIVPSTILSTSNLPSDVIEDTVFPFLPVVSKEISVPSNFSHLKDVIKPANNKDNSPSKKFHLRNNPPDQTTKPEERANQPSSTIAAYETKTWSREEDKLIIYNCQRFGLTEKVFKMSSVALKTRTVKEEISRMLEPRTLVPVF